MEPTATVHGRRADKPIAERLDRLVALIERAVPPAASLARFRRGRRLRLACRRQRLQPVAEVNRVELALLKGIDRLRDILLENTERFAAALPANNVLLWGARGMGKSSLVKAVHAARQRRHGARR